jgi:hypothetical protein
VRQDSFFFAWQQVPLEEREGTQHLPTLKGKLPLLISAVGLWGIERGMKWEGFMGSL